MPCPRQIGSARRTRPRPPAAPRSGAARRLPSRTLPLAIGRLGLAALLLGTVELTQGGLYAAAEEFADRAPIPVELDFEPGAERLPAAVETTGWFVLSEAPTNAIKHARARELRVHLGQADGCLTIVVGDDGVGGAAAGAGAGLRGMADWVEAHDGRLVVDSPPGGGTRIVAEVPCGS